MKTNEIEDFGTVYPNPNQASPNARPPKPQQDQSDEDEDSIYDDEEQAEDFEDDDDVEEEFDIAGRYSSDNMKDVYDYMKSSL